MRSLIFPQDEILRSVFGQGLSPNERAAHRSYRARSERAIAGGVLPRKVYISPRIYGFDKSELEAALERLPGSYAGFSKPSTAPTAA